jgi:serine acetyltransferase/GT2 family glycosyltransferase
MSSSPQAAASPPAVRLSVVIPAYDRPERAAQLVEALAAQTLAPGLFEVVLVDDGSPVDLRPRLVALTVPFRLVVVRQENRGPAAARHHGVSLARGDVLLFLDVDMALGPRLLEAHLAAHDATPRAVVSGAIRAALDVEHSTLFERFHAQKLDRYTAALRRSGRAPRGHELCTGNVSMRRADYLAVGGFDLDLGRSEDAELGVRLEQAGCAFRFSDEAYTVHDSHHTDLTGWLSRAYNYGVFELRIARKHPDALDISPWHYLDATSKLPQPAYLLGMAAPRLGWALSRGFMAVAAGLDRLGLARPAIAATMGAYGVEYYRGVRGEAGSGRACLEDLRRFRRRQRLARRAAGRGSARRAAFERFLTSVRADHAMLLHYDGKYDARGRDASSLPRALVERLGFQMMASFRLMRLARDLGSPLGARVISRLIRLVYDAEVHWDAEIADGVCLNHGMALGIGHGARIGKGVILAHSVSLGEGIDPVTRAVGGPTLEEGVHVAPGAILIGPITIGARSKIMPGAVVLTSVPPDSLVESPVCRIRPRARPVAAPSTPVAVAAPSTPVAAPSTPVAVAAPRAPSTPVAVAAPPPTGGA